MIDVVDYDPAWPSAFAQLEKRYRAALSGMPILGIEHVGSTSVPGLAAKPVIDVDIVVARPHVAAASAALAAIGFEPLGDKGVPDRWAFRSPSDSIRTNTYVVVDGCLSLRNHLGVRDVLRNDPVLRDEYARLKQRLASELDDVDAYTEAKSGLIQRILVRAGIGLHERNLIEEINRR